MNEFDDLFADFPPLLFDDYPFPRSHLIDFGVFAELTAVLGNRWRLTTGGRIDGVRTHADATYRAVDPIGDEHIFDFGSDVDVDNALYHAFSTRTISNI